METAVALLKIDHRRRNRFRRKCDEVCCEQAHLQVPEGHMGGDDQSAA